MKDKIASWQEELRDKAPGEVLAWAARQFPGKIVLASSLGAEDQVLTELIASHAPEIEIFSLDTGRLFQESYQVIEETEKKYGVKIQLYYPDTARVEEMVQKNGINLFYKSVDLRKLCCQVRKTEPLKRALTGREAWVVGLRREQAVTRAGLEVIEWDEGNNLVKISPLWNWDEEQVWNYIKEHGIPYNRLHDQGFLSIGCAPCTRAVQPGEDVRAGRWWWEQPEQKECGLHIVDGQLQPAKKSSD